MDETKATEYITIPVAEYHFLTKAATMLEVILEDKSYQRTNVLDAVRSTMQRMTKGGETE